MVNKIAIIGEKQLLTAKIFTSYRNSIGVAELNPFRVTDLRPEVELMHLLYACADIIVMFKTHGIG